MIPKIVFQTSYYPIESYVTEKLKTYISDEWTYLYFNDNDIKEFFKKNPLYEFPDIEKVFDSFGGPHKADLFRYYFLYINGGVYIDSDAMPRCSLDDVISNCDLFYVYKPVSGHFPASVFNGFIGCIPKHQIIYDALVDAYNTSPAILAKNYFLLCNNLVTFVDNHPLSNIKTFYEGVSTSTYAIISDSARNPILFHYHYSPKIIPKDLI